MAPCTYTHVVTCMYIYITILPMTAAVCVSGEFLACFLMMHTYIQLDHCEEQMASAESFKQLADAKAGSLTEDICQLFFNIVKACTIRRHKKRITSDEVIGHSLATYYIQLSASLPSRRS